MGKSIFFSRSLDMDFYKNWRKKWHQQQRHNCTATETWCYIVNNVQGPINNFAQRFCFLCYQSHHFQLQMLMEEGVPTLDKGKMIWKYCICHVPPSVVMRICLLSNSTFSAFVARTSLFTTTILKAWMAGTRVCIRVANILLIQ